MQVLGNPVERMSYDKLDKKMLCFNAFAVCRGHGLKHGQIWSDAYLVSIRYS